MTTGRINQVALNGAGKKIISARAKDSFRCLNTAQRGAPRGLYILGIALALPQRLCSPSTILKIELHLAIASSLSFPPSEARDQGFLRVRFATLGALRAYTSQRMSAKSARSKACKQPCTSMHSGLHSVYAMRNQYKSPNTAKSIHKCFCGITS